MPVTGRPHASLSWERRMARRGFRCVCGVDEAGRGPLAGPVVAAAVVLSPKARRLTGIEDSKKLPPHRREFLFDRILRDSAVGVGVVSEREIDRINIYQATRRAMREAVGRLLRPPDCLLIDGPLRLDVEMFQEAVPGGDRLCRSIAAASIVAKVVRDRMMRIYDRTFPQYGFSRHKGYPTPGHVAALKIHGPSRIHRMSFGPVRLARGGPAAA